MTEPREAQPPTKTAVVHFGFRGAQWDAAFAIGFGFIDDDGGRRLFFHVSAVPDGVSLHSLREGQRCSFTPTDAGRGPRAEHVVVFMTDGGM